MKINENSTPRIIIVILVVNLGMALLIGVSIGYIAETGRTSEGISGICIGAIFASFMDILFLLGRKHLFSKVILENEMIKIVYFKKILKQIKISDIKILFVQMGTFYLMTEKAQNINIESIKQLQKKPDTIMFKIDLKQIGYFLSQVNLDVVYYWKQAHVNNKSEIEKYITLKQLME